jgi:hypothetical protein
MGTSGGAAHLTRACQMVCIVGLQLLNTLQLLVLALVAVLLVLGRAVRDTLKIRP